LAPADVQEKADCIVGVNYPKKLLDHDSARKICSSRMREVYSGLVVKGIMIITDNDNQMHLYIIKVLQLKISKA
jgi:hypothetical protein